jgi:hypothetical protein
MTNTDLAEQIRDLVDVAPPVSVSEATTQNSTIHFTSPGSVVTPRASGSPASVHTGNFGEARQPMMRRSTAWVSGVAAASLVLGGGAALVARQGSFSPTTHGKAPVVVVLSARDVSDITAESSAAMAATGMAQVTDIIDQAGAPQSEDSGTVTFSGQNIDENDSITSYMKGQPPHTFGVDDREVGGQFYIYTPGPDDVTRWYHDTGSDNDQSMSFPDPRTLYSQIDADADFEVVGTSTLNGHTVTHLQARDAAAIPEASFTSLTSGPLTSFQMWVDRSNVVQRMSFSSAQTLRTCPFIVGQGRTSTSKEIHIKDVLPKVPGKGATMWEVEPANSSGTTTCGTQTSTQEVSVTFSGLGGDETVVAPPNAIDFVGKG